MKRLVILTMVMVVLMGISDKALAGPWTGTAFGMSQTYGGCGYYGYSGSAFRMTRSYGSGRYGWYGGYSGYGYNTYPSTNVRVKYNERWDLQGGQRSYEQSPDLNGKIIDGAIILGALAISR